MKRTFILLFAAALLGSLSAFTLISPGKVSISVKESVISIGKEPLNPDWNLAPVLEYLEKPDRVTMDKSKVLVYDKAGICVYEKLTEKERKPTGKIELVRVCFILPKPSDTNPKAVFEGKMKIDDLELHKDLTYEKVRSGLSDWTAQKESAAFTSLTLVRNDVILQFEFTGRGHQLREVHILREAAN